MSDAVETPGNTETPAPTPSGIVSKEQIKADLNDDPKDLPEWARKKITEANQEAAQRRVQLRTVEEDNRTLQEQLATLKSERDDLASVSTSVQTDFDKLATAVKSLLPEKHLQVFTFAKTLQGSTGEELSDHAAELNKMFGISASPSPAVDRSQGHGSGAPASDPASQFAAFLNSRLSK